MTHKKQKPIAKTPKPVVFDTYAQASVHLNMPVRILKKAKRAGCPGFRHHRIYVDEARPWLKRHAKELASPGEKEKLEIRKLKGECERIEFRNSVEAEKFWPSEEVRHDWLAHMQRARKVWSDVIENLSPQLVGRSVLEIQRLLQEASDRGIEQLRTDPFGRSDSSSSV